MVTTERGNVMAVLNTQPNYSAGDTISVGSSTTAASAITNYNNLRQQKQTALNNAATATTQYNTANTAALQKQSQATAAMNAASQAATAAATAQDNADDALAYAQQLESELPVGNGEDGPPSFEFSQLGAVSTTSFEYGNRGLLAKTTDAVGFSERLTYDAFGRLAAEVGKSSFAAPQSGAIPDGGTKTYQYDKRGLLLSETLPIQSYNSAGNALGAITHTYEYDARGNLIAKTEADGLPEERVTQYVYDNLGRLTQTIGESRNWASINASTKAVSSGSATPTETISYDANGNVVRLQDPAGAVTVFYYDALHRKTLEINALGTYTAYEYDANGNIARILVYENTVSVPALGAPAPTLPTGAKRETTFTYNGLNQLIASHVHGVTTGSHTGTGWAVHNADGLADPDLLTTRYEYDYLGNAVKLIDPRGNSVWSYYDALGRKTTQVDGEGYRTDWSYNSDGNVLTERRYATKAAIAVSTTNPPSVATDGAKDRVTTYTYDKNGNAIADREVVDMIASVYGPVDFAKGSWRLAHGEVTLENGLSVGFGLLGALGSARGLLSAGGKIVAAESAEAIAINPRLITRLTKWQDYQAGGGQLNMQGWIKATQGQSWGLGGRSGYADWIARVESTHGNSLLSNRTASLYELYTKEGKFLKYGVSQSPYSRYSDAFMDDKEIFPITSGPRSQMINLERQMVIQNPGPLNLEPWANAARTAGRGQ